MTPNSDLFACPSCGVSLVMTETGWSCPSESYDFGTTQNIPDFLLPSRRPEVEAFLSYYGQVRRAESWGSHEIEYYLQLPFRDLTNRYSSTWKVRAKTFQAFKKDVRKEYSHSSIRILDLGAGNCWLSYRLAQQGYTVTAVDINIDSNDGLAVAQKLMRSGSVHFRCVRAEFDFLPFPARSFDVIIFNASLHYSSAPVQTIQRTLPLLNGQGTIYILDSPLYKNPESGKAMVNERLELYRSTFGLQRPERPTQSFLTFGQLEEIRSFANVTTLQPAYGLLWKARRLFAMRFKRREPATFLILKIKRQ